MIEAPTIKKFKNIPYKPIYFFPSVGSFME